MLWAGVLIHKELRQFQALRNTDSLICVSKERVSDAGFALIIEVLHDVWNTKLVLVVTVLRMELAFLVVWNEFFIQAMSFTVDATGLE